MRAGIYCRISRDREDLQLGVDRQEEDCRALCAERDWEVAGVYMDNNKTAANPGTKRPAYDRLLDDIKNGLLDAVVVWDSDRLHRRPFELEQFVTVCDAAGLIHLASVDTDHDLNNDDALYQLRIEVAAAQREIAKIKKRLARKQLQLAKDGLPSGGGTRPFGFERGGLIVREDEAYLIRDAAQRILSGESLYSIRQRWAEAGVETVTGAEWSVTAIRTLLLRPRMVGRRQYKGVDYGNAAWPAILDVETWEQLKKVLNDPSRRQNPPSREYHLYGILRCGCDCDVCTRPDRPPLDGEVIQPRRLLTAMPRKNGRNYGCRKTTGGGQVGCGHVYISGPLVEAHVLSQVLPLVDSPVFLESLAGEVSADRDMVRTLVMQIAEDEATKAELGDDFYQRRVIDKQTFLRQDAALRERIDQARTRLATLQGADALGALRGRVRESWPTLAPEQKRRVLAAVLTEIRVGQSPRRGSNRFDTSRIKIIWRFDTLSQIAEDITKTWTTEDWEHARLEYDRLNEPVA